MQVSPHHLMRYHFAGVLAEGRTLDAACGCGYGSQLLTLGGKEVVGIDQSAEAIDWAKMHFRGPKYIHGNIEDFQWEGYFDTVVSLETIEHLKDPTPVLKAFRRICKR